MAGPSTLEIAVCLLIFIGACRSTYGANSCPPGEEWNKCGVVHACWNLDQPPKEEHCYQGCFCPEGRVKNKDGKCVLPSECQKHGGECGEDEEYKECTACPRTCESLFKKIKCTERCVPGCVCKGDLVKHEGKCIDIRKCPTQLCGLNEEFNKCGSACPETCSTLGHHQICTDQCVEGCFCKEGFVRDDSGICIQRSQCLVLKKSNGCGIDEEPYSCIPTCRDTCDNYNVTNAACAAICIPGCFCRRGWVKNRDGKCVPTCQCEPKTVEPHNSQTCGRDEVFYECSPICGGTCNTYKMRDRIRCACQPGCWCKEGMVKNSDGKCVPTTECEEPTVDEIKKCGEDEEYQECGTACPRTCQSLFIKIRCVDRCMPGCFCKGDLVKHEGKCIDIRKCPPQTCGLNEEYTTCGYACPPTCSSLANGEPQFCSQQCVQGCFCKKGFVKNEDGQCVEPTQCPKKTCGLNEEYKACGSACPPTCSSLADPEPRVCSQQCVPGCFCKEGYVKNDDGQCVEQTQCPNTRCDERDEVYQSCGTACPRTCSNRRFQIKCMAECVSGCFCREGLLRNDQGKCVTSRECDKEEKCGENEEYDTCGTACPKTCADKDQYVACTQQCKIGCFCKEGYVKNAQGKCILPEQCPSGNNECSGLNEVMSNCAKPKSCNTCEIRGDCKLKTCVMGCDCKPDHFRNSDGICIPEAQCTTVDDSGVSDCSLPPYTGPCKGRIVRFYFDAASKQCKTFTYGGCQANSNNFKNERECIRKCGREKVEYDCDKGAVSGECKGNLRRFYFDSALGECRAFTYGGCGGNKNNFRDRKECIRKCTTPPAPGSMVSGRTGGSVCDVSFSKGPCTSFETRYFFNKASGTCETFSYGGCKGNKNNFRSEDECYQQCGDGSSKRPDCYQPPDSGPCKAMEPRFYFEMNSGECKSFNYGGCEGNTNNFKTADECQRKCGSE